MLVGMTTPPYTLFGVAITLYNGHGHHNEPKVFYHMLLSVVIWTYLTGSPQRENIVGRRTHSGQACTANTQAGRDTK